jgi:SAM-dependent methyltransferase
VLAIGAGFYRDVLPFVARGCQVVALEPVPEYVERAPPGVTAIVGYVEDLPFDAAPLGGAFDVAVFLHTTYAYTVPSAVRVAVLAKVRGLLADAGRILICLPDAAPPRTPIALTRFVAKVTRAGWTPEPGDLFPDGTFRWIEHRFADGELEREAQAGGLSVVSMRTSEGMRLYELAAPRTGG